jgi:uncharacterized protein YxjI
MLNRQTYFIKERVKLLRISDTYDILDPETQEHIGIAVERPGQLAKVLRLLISKQLLPTRIDIHDDENNPPLMSIRRGVTLLGAKIDILNANGQLVGYFKSKLFTLSGGFRVYDIHDKQVAEVKGNWKGWNFKFLDTSGNQLGTVTKSWAGLSQELFSSADNYIIRLQNPDHGTSGLLLAAGLAIDAVYNEN